MFPHGLLGFDYQNRPIVYKKFGKPFSAQKLQDDANIHVLSAQQTCLGNGMPGIHEYVRNGYGMPGTDFVFVISSVDGPQGQVGLDHGSTGQYRMCYAYLRSLASAVMEDPPRRIL
eukprot:3246560-Rhodomonas_salina.5